MPPNVISRYQQTYRKDEIDLVIRLAKRGESLGFVGVAGVGKSNIVNFLRDIQKNAPQVKQDMVRLHFPIVDATQWQGTPISLWRMMLEALGQVTKGLSPPAEDNKIIPISEEERVFNVLRARLEWFCQEIDQQVMFVLDDFDAVIQGGPLAMLEQLNVLRSEGNRGLLSYLVFTKRLPHILGYSHHFDHQSKFYDLFRHNIYALEPYTHDDTMRMLSHLNQVADKPLSDSQLEQIYQFAGGHARLLRTVFNIWAEEDVSGMKITYFAAKPDIQQECGRIFMNLHEHEQEVALRVARGQQTAADQAVVDHLVRRGLLTTSSGSLVWFSPLLAQFLATYKVRSE